MRHGDIVEKFGENSAVGTSTETVWSPGGLYVYPSADGVLTVASDAGGTDEGGQVTIQGCNEANTEVEATVTLDVTGAATTTEQFFRVFRAFYADTVTTGTVTISHGTLTVAQVAAAVRQTQMAVYSAVDRGKRCFITFVKYESGANDEVDFWLFVRNSPTKPFRARDSALSSGGPVPHPFVSGVEVPIGGDVEVRAARVSGASARVTAEFTVEYRAESG